VERKYSENSSVVYVDPHGVEHTALVTIWWTGNREVSAYRSENGEPGCNLLWVSDDDTKTDPYGRQIERATSVVHKTKQAAHGNYWCWPDECLPDES
jgi:hypothetical protein